MTAIPSAQTVIDLVGDIGELFEPFLRGLSEPGFMASVNILCYRVAWTILGAGENSSEGLHGVGRQQLDPQENRAGG
jgi:hypothetical protein